jgi:hypothetical protein
LQLYFGILALIAFSLPIAEAASGAFLLTPKYQANSKVPFQSGREYLPVADISGGGSEMGPQTTMVDTVNTEIEILPDCPI